MTASPRSHRLAYASAALALLLFWNAGFVLLGGFQLDLGSLFMPRPRYTAVVQLWCLFGGLASVLLAAALFRHSISSSALRALLGRLAAPPTRRTLAGWSVAAFLLPLSIRIWLLLGGPLSDDEGAYRFGAQLLATGRLWVPSPPLKLFFDQNFMINDGRLYPAYFLGWPALLALGLLAGVPAAVSPLLSALTVPPLARLFARYAGARWVSAGLLVFLTSPFIQVMAATDMAHTACLAALTWALLCYTESGTGRVSRQIGFGLFSAAAFCIRPQAAVPLLLPLAVGWLRAQVSAPAAVARRNVLACAVPVLAVAAAFLGVLWMQNGSPFATGYARYGRYLIENDFRFTTFDITDLTPVAGFTLGVEGLAGVVLRGLGGLARLNFDLFGWPSSLALLIAARPRLARGTGALWAMLVLGVGVLFFQRDWGIDTFGPVHAFELTLPILLLTMAGARALAMLVPPATVPELPPETVPGLCVVLALVTTSCLGLTPVRLRGVHQVASHVHRALDAPRRAGLQQAVVFAPFPLTASCTGVPAHFVFFRPPNDPDLHNDVVWANHLSDADDRALLTALGRTDGRVLEWTHTCEVVLRPLGE